VAQLVVTPLNSSHRFVAGDELLPYVLQALETAGIAIEHHDLLVVTSKVVSKCEGRVVPFDGTPHMRESLIVGESRRVLRRRGPLHITETHQGFVNANAGIDFSNTEPNTAVLLPLDSDKSARALRAQVEHATGKTIGLVITDTFGRTWRNGVADVALGAAGINVIDDLRGQKDDSGKMLEVTQVAVADEIASAANLVVAKDGNTPFVHIRGLAPKHFGVSSVAEHILRSATDDLFR
jgi:coenzyme F420-0:L-glutamate ligase / coenzyme F420-1:gamma-L-glutamate ligase